MSHLWLFSIKFIDDSILLISKTKTILLVTNPSPRLHFYSSSNIPTLISAFLYFAAFFIINVQKHYPNYCGTSHPIKCSYYILYIYLGESLSLKKLHCTHKLMINYCTKFWQSKKVMCNFPMNSGGTGLDTSGAITQFGTTFESSSGLEVREIWSTISYHIALWHSTEYKLLHSCVCV